MITSAQNSGAIVFPRCEEGVQLCTHYSVGVKPSGPTMYLWSGRFSMPISVVPGFTPSFPIDACAFGIGTAKSEDLRDDAEARGRMGVSFQRALMEWLFQNAPIPDVGSGVFGSDLPLSFLIAMHTADPGPRGDQSTHQASYRGYCRVPVHRSRLGWSVQSDDEQ